MDLMVNKYFSNVDWGPSMAGSRGRLICGSVVSVAFPVSQRRYYSSRTQRLEDVES